MGLFKRLFGHKTSGEESRPEPALDAAEVRVIGTDEDLMRDFDAQSERNFHAAEADQRGDLEAAVALYEQSVSEEFVGSHPYEQLARIYERQHRTADALRVTDAFISLAGSGRLPKGSQRSAERKLPEFTARSQRLRGNGDSTPNDPE